jgi:ribonuclease Z
MTKKDLAKTTGHSTTIDAATTALNAGAKKLLIGHFSARYKDIMPLVEEARTVFPETYPAIDGKTYEVGNI